MTDPAALVRGAKLRSGEYRVCLDPDLVDEHAALVARREAEADAAHDSLAGGNVAAVDEALDDVRERMDAATLTLRLRALPRPEYRALVDKHPPRMDGDGNVLLRDRLGVNYDTFYGELVRACLVEPVLDAETVDVLLDEKLSDAQWEELTNLAHKLNRSTVDIPFSSGGSPSRRTTSPR